MTAVVDGNALAGALTGALGADPTSALLRCDGCGATGPLARTSVHISAMGCVARCRDCDRVLVTVVETPDRRWIGLPGTRATATLVD